MKNNIIQFTGVEERKKQITEMVLQGVPEDRKEAYWENAFTRMLLKFDYLNADSQNKLFDYLMTQARENVGLRKRNFVLELLETLSGKEAWEKVENMADKFLSQEIRA